VQFITNGPDIPERLLQAHKDERVVFFCGAGISQPAGLPGFKGLVDKLYNELNINPTPVEETAIKAEQFDTAIGLLEGRVVGSRNTVRNALARILSLTLDQPNATATHESLLTLGTSIKGKTRLITTNFDRLFEKVISSKDLKVERFQAPLVPIPKNDWDGLVYLHGLLPTEPTTTNLNRLVVSSGDFGLAYLTERWAARFVTELFRNYTVCFVGYSINDPVLRYMMDALAADRLLGGSPHEMFAFGSYSITEKQNRENEWRAKNVTPILYLEDEDNGRAYLGKTLHTWATTMHTCATNQIVKEYAGAPPQQSTQQDNFVGRLLWALSDPGGNPAKHFASMEPVPSLDWLEPLSEKRYRHFGLDSMCVVDFGASSSDWDKVMRQLAHWLIRHLGDPALLFWLLKRGDQLHHNFVDMIENRLNELATLQRDKKEDELNNIRTHSPKAIPDPQMRTFWRLLLAGRVKSSQRKHDDYLKFESWEDRFQLDGLTISLRLELREMLKPLVLLSGPSRRPVENGDDREPERMNDLVEWQIVLPTDKMHDRLKNLRQKTNLTDALPDLLSDFSALLRDALDLMRELGGVGDRSDRFDIHQPSISEHLQNKNDRDDWTALIDLTRDAWVATSAQSPARAALVAESWLHEHYPLFRRLAFFAATQDGVIAPHLALEWLLADAHKWLWSIETKLEAMHLMVVLAPQLNQAMLRKLEQAILKGPPSEIFTDDRDRELYTSFADREILLRLAKINETSAVLSAKGKERLKTLLDQHPAWAPATDQRDEFSCWISEGDELRQVVTTPRPCRDLIDWLRQESSRDQRQEDDWRQRCRDDFDTTADALCELAKDNFWPRTAWKKALWGAWSEEKLIKLAWRRMASILTRASNDVLKDLADAVSYWLLSSAKTFEDDSVENDSVHFFKLAHSLLALDHNDRPANASDPVTHALNQPVGRVTKALLDWWYRAALEDGQGLHEKIKLTFTKLCDTQISTFLHGRVLLAANVIMLFRVDRDWAMQHLLPIFNWTRCEMQACQAWRSFLSSKRMYHPLIAELKSNFLDTAQYYSMLGRKHGELYVSWLTRIALDGIDTFTINELSTATAALPAEGLHYTARSLVKLLQDSGDKHADYWSNRIDPYLQKIWPKKDLNKNSPETAVSLGLLCVAAQSKFPEALRNQHLHEWLKSPQPSPYPYEPYNIVRQLDTNNLCSEFPEAALELLSIVIVDRNQPSLTKHLQACLDAIIGAKPSLDTDPQCQKLQSVLNWR
jgi:hypothetical protein